jgi:hypothetical protein
MSSSVHDTRVQAARERLAEALRTGAPTGAFRAAIANLDASAAAAAQREADKRAAEAAAEKAAAEVEIEARAVQIANEARTRIEVSIERFQYRPATRAAACTDPLCDANTVASEATASDVTEPGLAANTPTGAASQAEAEPTTNTITITKETDHV